MAGKLNQSPRSRASLAEVRLPLAAFCSLALSWHKWSIPGVTRAEAESRRFSLTSCASPWSVFIRETQTHFNTNLNTRFWENH